MRPRAATLEAGMESYTESEERKARLRREMRNSLLARGSEEIARLSARACASVIASAAWKSAPAILSYLAIAGELDPFGIGQAALATGRVLALPLVSGAGLRFHVVASLSLPWGRSRFGTREPPPGLPELEAGRGLLLVPGLAFDRSGNRLGRGGGHYDRFLAQAGGGITRVGLCFSTQVVDRLPRTPGDEPVDFVVTENGVIAPALNVGEIDGTFEGRQPR